MRVLIPVLLASALALSGCHRQASAPSPRPQAAPQHRPREGTAQTPAEQTAGMVDAPSQGKAQAPVALKFDLAQRPVVGQPLKLAIAILPQVPAGPMSVKAVSSPGIDFATGDQDFEWAAVEALGVYRHEITLTPSAEGVQLVNLTVSIKHDEVTDTRSFAVPLIVAGTPADASAPAAAPARPAAAPAGKAAAGG